MLANDVRKIAQPGGALYSCTLNPQGGVIDDLIVYHLSKHYYRIVFNASTRDIVCAWLIEHLGKEQVTLTLRDEDAMLAIQGPAAMSCLEKLLTPAQAGALATLKPFKTLAAADLFIARTGYTGEDGFEIILPQTKAVDFWKRAVQAGAKPCGLGARDTLRLEAGLNLFGTDMDPAHTPIEANLTWTVSFTDDRDFIGKEALLALMQKPHAILVGIVLLEKGVLRNHLPVTSHDSMKGVITSGSFSPTLGRGIAMARVPQGFGPLCEVWVREKPVKARVVPLPFLRKGRSLIADLIKESCHE
jgi:aminomethyltransferase